MYDNFVVRIGGWSFDHRLPRCPNNLWSDRGSCLGVAGRVEMSEVEDSLFYLNFFY
jgi:hypothetical protein